MTQRRGAGFRLVEDFFRRRSEPPETAQWRLWGVLVRLRPDRPFLSACVCVLTDLLPLVISLIVCSASSCAPASHHLISSLFSSPPSLVLCVTVWFCFLVFVSFQVFFWDIILVFVFLLFAVSVLVSTAFVCFLFLLFISDHCILPSARSPRLRCCAYCALYCLLTISLSCCTYCTLYCCLTISLALYISSLLASQWAHT